MSESNDDAPVIGEHLQSTATVNDATPANKRGAATLWWRRGDAIRLTIAALVCVLLGALVTWVLPYVGVPMRTGPLAWRDGGNVPLEASLDPHTGSYAFGMRPHRVGYRFTYAMDVLTLPPGSTDTAVIKKVEPLGLGPGVRYLGAMLGSPDRTETWSNFDGWPPGTGRLRDPVPLDTSITSRTADAMGWELYLGFQITRPGYYVSDGWQVTYEVAGRTYRYTVGAQAAICTPEALTRGRFCPLPEGR